MLFDLVAVLVDLRLTRGEALLLFGLFTAQFVLPAPNVRYGIAVAYVLLALTLLVRRRRHLPALLAAVRRRSGTRPGPMR